MKKEDFPLIHINTKEVLMAICPNNRRDGQTSYDLVSKHLELTSTIHMDAWRGYNGLLVGGFANHLTVNLSLHFVDPIIHVHTNNIESRWQALRNKLSQGGIWQNQVDSHILEYLWRLDCENRSADPFLELIEDIKTVYPVQYMVCVCFFL